MSAETEPTPPSSPTMVNAANLEAIGRDWTDNQLVTSSICSMLNEFLREFELMEATGETTTEMFLNAVEEIVNAVLSIQPQKLLAPEILEHPLILFLRQMLIDILHNWRSSQWRLNIQETDIFLKIVLIFVHAAEQAPAASAEEDRKRIKELLATKRTIFLIREQIDDSTMNKKGINDDPNICTLGLLTIDVLQGCPFYYTMQRNEQMIDDLVMNCLDSFDYVQALRQLQHGAKLTDIDRYLLFTCWKYVPFVSAPTHASGSMSTAENMAQSIYDDLLERLRCALDEPPPVAPPSFAYIFERCAQLLSIPHLRAFNKHVPDIVDRLTKMLESPKTMGNADDDKALVIVALEAFHTLSKITDVRAVIKSRQLVPLFKKFTSPEMGKMREIAFAILAQIMDEKDIKESAGEITAFFVDKLKRLGQNIDSITLSSLKALTQHDEIKNELVKQSGFQTLISFIRDGDPEKQSPEQLQDALEILWSCTFNNPDVKTVLKLDTQLMARVHQLQESSKQSGNVNLEKAAEGVIWKVEKAAEGVIWKVEKEDKFREDQAAEAEQRKLEKKRKAAESGKEEDEEEEEAEQYDLMISYSWADMDLAHRIYNHLTTKLGYKIWLDQEQMHGSTIQAMANAVENAQFILMCMSDTYQRSANCQSEAEYAFNRKKHIVPLKMKKDFTATGWLGFILGTRMYIDFGQYEFDKAIVLLDNEIQLQKKKRKAALQTAKEQKAAAASKMDGDQDGKPELTSQPPVNLTEMSSWNETVVRDFLMENKLSPMVPLCEGITGEELLTLYAMCKTSSASMYRSLKFELLHVHHKLLPISTYLRFLSRVRLACADNQPSNAGATPAASGKHTDDHLHEDE